MPKKVNTSTKEKTVAGRADTGTELIATVKQSTDPYTVKTIMRLRNGLLYVRK